MYEKYYRIGEVVEILGVEAHTLRYLENTLHLKIKRNGRGERLYSESDLELLQLIHKWKTENHLNTHAIRMALEHLEKQEEPVFPPPPVQPDQSPENRITHVLLHQNEQLLARLLHLEEMMKKQAQRQEEQMTQLLELLNRKAPQTFRWWVKK